MSIFRCLWLVALALPWGAQAQDAPLSLNQAVAQALAHNPNLAAIEARLTGLQAAVEPAGVLPDPKASLGVVNMPPGAPGLDRDPMTQVVVGVTQPLPYPGRLDLQRQIAQAKAAGGQAQLAEARLALAREVKLTWWHLAYLDRALALHWQTTEELNRLVEGAEARYRVGKGFQGDVWLARSERARIDPTIAALQAQRAGAQAQLAALLDLPPNTPIMLPDRDLPPLPAHVEPTPPMAKALQARPLLMAAAAEIAGARAGVGLADSAWIPTFDLGASYGIRSGNRRDLASITLSATLPLHGSSRQVPLLDQARSEQSAAGHRRHQAENRVRAEVIALVAELNRYLATVADYDERILPAAQGTVTAMEAAYGVGKVDFLNLVRARLTQLSDTVMALRARILAFQAQARLDAAVGQEVTP